MTDKLKAPAIHISTAPGERRLVYAYADEIEALKARAQVAEGALAEIRREAQVISSVRGPAFRRREAEDFIFKIGHKLLALDAEKPKETKPE